MNRINQLFQDSPKNLLSVYFCAGFPTLDSTADVIRTLEKNGVNMVEIGIPFSDPMADGIVIQDAATRALHNGMSLRILFEQLQDIRRDVRIPLIFLCDGLIIFFVFPERQVGDDYAVNAETSEKRIREIDVHTDGFIYMVSSAATTGAQKDFDVRKQVYFKKIQDMNLRNPRMVGFGISNRQTFDTACSHASGAIIGSRFVTLLDEYKGNAQKAISHLKEDLGKSGKAAGQ